MQRQRGRTANHMATSIVDSAADRLTCLSLGLWHSAGSLRCIKSEQAQHARRRIVESDQ